MLKVNEIFGPTLQGEGKSLGKPVVFLRTALCNLHCIWCDTPFTWNWEGMPYKHPEKFRREDEVHEMETDEVVSQLITLGGGTKALVVSGGEPLLQQHNLLKVFRELKGWWIEIETNGTIAPTEEFVAAVSQINCSPKLSNNQEDKKTLRERPNALTKLSACGKTNFKFVVTSAEDASEILELVDKYRMGEVFLMPEGRTREEQERNQETVEQLCIKYGFRFTPRLHILLWGDKRGA